MPTAKKAAPKSAAAKLAAPRPPASLPKPAHRTPAQHELARAAARQYRTTLTRDTFLRSQGPAVIEVELPNIGSRALMRRIDLLELAKRGGEHWPFRLQVLSMIQTGKISNEMMVAEGLAKSLELAEAVALACIVVPPPEYIAAADEEHETEEQEREAREAVLASLKPSDLRPLFVAQGEEPDEDQVVLRWFSPDDEDAAGPENADLSAVGFPLESAEEAGYMHWADLIAILRAAHRNGPGALGRRFRGEPPAEDPLGALLELASRQGSPA